MEGRRDGGTEGGHFTPFVRLSDLEPAPHTATRNNSLPPVPFSLLFVSDTVRLCGVAIRGIRREGIFSQSSCVKFSVLKFSESEGSGRQPPNESRVRLNDL